MALTKQKLNRELAFVASRLPRKATKHNYQLSNRLLRVSKHKNYVNNLQDELQRVADILAEHLLLERKIKVIIIPNAEASAVFETIQISLQENLYTIRLSNDTIYQSFSQKVAILAHSLTHYALMEKYKIPSAEVSSNNKVTSEVFGIYLGFGFLYALRNTQHKVQTGNLIKTTRVGILDQKDINYLIAQTATKRKQNPVWVISNARLSEKLYFIFRLFPLLLKYYRGKVIRSPSTRGIQDPYYDYQQRA